MSDEQRLEEIAEASETGVPVPIATMDDPHMREAVADPHRAERVIGIYFVIGIAGMVGFGAAFTQNAAPWTLGVSLGVGLFFLGFGLSAWGKYLMPQGPFSEMRHSLRSTKAERDAIAAALVERTGVVVKRRKVLGGLLGTGLGIFGIVAVFPLLRSLGPLPKKTLTKTNWRSGSLLVDSTGRAIHRDLIQPGGLVTVFPAGFENDDQTISVDQTVLIRVQSTDLVTEPGRESWGPDGYVAYSKMCTHAGCPVGLYERELRLLVCPCHQSMFNVDDGAVPEFGPAPRPLPQLPLYVDGNGLLRSQAGYNEPIGPGYWERTT
ncbi:MAG: Rieske 2Fe-2S domain-containing protein [Acidimicrobiales bacterium]